VAKLAKEKEFIVDIDYNEYIPMYVDDVLTTGGKDELTDYLNDNFTIASTQSLLQK
jgi:hypothetical protein